MLKDRTTGKECVFPHETVFIRNKADKSGRLWKIRLASLIFSLFPALLPAEDVFWLFGKNSLSIDIGFSSGIMGGKFSEHVFDSASGRQVSLLDWIFGPLVTFSGQFRCVFKNRLQLETSLVWGETLYKNGFMEDRDWLGSDGRLTNYSKHDLEAKGLTMEAAAGWQFRFFDGSFLLIPKLKIFWRDFRFHAADGFLQYAYGGKWNDSIPKVEISGDVASYTVSTAGTGLELEILWRKTPKLSFGLCCAVYPVVYGEAMDEHHQRNLTYRDIGMGGISVFALSARTDIRLAFSDMCSIFIKIQADHLPVIAGDTFASYGNEEEYTKMKDSSGGSSGWSGGVSAGIICRIL